MGGELAEWEEWNYDGSLHWNLLEYPEHQGVQSLVRDLNHAYRAKPALYEVDFEPSGFRWLEANDAANNVLAFARLDANGERPVVCVLNLSPVPRYDYRVGMPRLLPLAGARQHRLRVLRRLGRRATSAASRPRRCRGTTSRSPRSLTLPPLGAVWFVPE